MSSYTAVVDFCKQSLENLGTRVMVTSLQDATSRLRQRIDTLIILLDRVVANHTAACAWCRTYGTPSKNRGGL